MHIFKTFMRNWKGMSETCRKNVSVSRLRVRCCTFWHQRQVKDQICKKRPPQVWPNRRCLRALAVGVECELAELQTNHLTGLWQHLAISFSMCLFAKAKRQISKRSAIKISYGLVDYPSVSGCLKLEGARAWQRVSGGPRAVVTGRPLSQLSTSNALSRLPPAPIVQARTMCM